MYDFPSEQRPSHATTKLVLFPVNGAQERALVSPLRMLFPELMLNSEKIKHVALAIVELHWSEGISQLGRQAVSYLVS